MERLVIIPTYNEIENIREIIAAVFKLDMEFHVLIVDDSSPDGTSDVVIELQKTHPNLHIEIRKEKSGLGRAYIHGFKWALSKGYRYIFEMDADFSHDPNDLPRLYNAIIKNGADVSVGSRYVKGGKVKNWPLNRIMMSYFASIYVRMITWLPVKDTTAGFVCYTAKVLDKIGLDEIRFVGYAFQIEMKFKAYKLGFKLTEVPITFIDRVRGKSKMNIGIFKEAFLGVWKMRFS